jgi:hypothetical protein
MFFTFHNTVHVIYPNLTIFNMLLDKSIIAVVLSQLTRDADVGGCHGGVRPQL